MRSINVQKRAAYGLKDPIQVVAHYDVHRVTAHRCAGGLKEKLDQWSGSHAQVSLTHENTLVVGIHVHVGSILRIGNILILFSFSCQLFF